jgi:hypothetical protein
VTTQDAYDRYKLQCEKVWKVQPAPKEVYEKEIGHINNFGGTISAQSSYLVKPRS